MGPELIGPIVAAIVGAVIMVLKGLWGTDKPVEHEVEHAEQEIPIDDGKTDSDRVDDLL